MNLQLNKYYSENFSDAVLLTNTAGEYLFISKDDFASFSKTPENLADSTKALLKSRFFL